MAFGQVISPFGTVSYQYDAAGRRTRMTWPGGLWVSYEYLVTGEITHIREYGASSGAGVLAAYSYDNHGRMTQLERGNGVVTSYAYDAALPLIRLLEAGFDEGGEGAGGRGVVSSGSPR
ncbi:MAG: hypothetical protein KIS81_11550 [Maricaulaceae bacterium]|nr:hypothetical protein [Maricaulaceae bacterium]